MRAERLAYFRKHKGARRRAVFVRRQQQKLRTLRAAAACTVELPPQAGAPCAPALEPNRGAIEFEPRLGNAFHNEGPNTSPAVLPSLGRVDAVVIPVDFADASASEDARLVGTAVTADLAWFEAVSYGRFSVAATVLPRWYRLPASASSYPNWHSLEGGRQLLADATAAADAEVDFSVARFVFVAVPPAFPQRGNPAWTVLPGRGVVRDGVELRHATVMTARTAPVANHEFAHSLGLPDLYLLNEATGVADFELVGSWDFMSTPRDVELLAWHKWRLQWIDADQIACLDSTGTLDAHLTPVGQRGGVKMVVVRTTPSTAYVVEARAAVGRDQTQLRDGVLVYTVDSQVRNGQGPIRVLRPPGGLAGSAATPVGGSYEDATVRVEVLPPVRAGVWHVRVTRKS